MRSNLAILAAAAVAGQVAQAHYSFVRIAHNGVWQDPLRYIRNKTAPYTERYALPGHGDYIREYNFATVYPDYPESVRCGRDNIKHGPETEVLDVAVGDSLEFAIARSEPTEWSEKTWNCEGGAGSCYDGLTGFEYNHWGPIVVHISRVPDGEDIHTYDGSGEWVKIYTSGFKWRPGNANPVGWIVYNDEKIPSARWNFNIPSQTPSGQYLIRVGSVVLGQRIGPAGTDKQGTQLYHSCGHINVRNNGTANALPKGVKFPDIMHPDMPGMLVSEEMQENQKVDEGYYYPGGDIWDGETTRVDYPDCRRDVGPSC